jgi:hypothetical protein
VGPVVTIAGQQPNALAVPLNEHAEAIVFLWDQGPARREARFYDPASKSSGGVDLQSAIAFVPLASLQPIGTFGFN